MPVRAIVTLDPLLPLPSRTMNGEFEPNPVLPGVGVSGTGWSKQEVQHAGSEQPVLLEEPAVAGLLELKPPFVYISSAGSHVHCYAPSKRIGPKFSE